MDLTLLKRDSRGRVLDANHKRDLHTIISKEFGLLEPISIDRYSKKYLAVRTFTTDYSEKWNFITNRRLGRAIRKYCRNYPNKKRLLTMFKPIAYGSEVSVQELLQKEPKCM